MGVLKNCFLILALTGYYVTALNCTFDKDECEWHMDNELTDVTWTRAKTSPQKYGPQTDHTGKNGYFMHINTSSIYRKGQRTQLVSPKRNSTEKLCFSFWYHMYGNDVGTLNLKVKTSDRETIVWSRGSSEENAWKQGMITIISDQPYQIVIEAIVGSHANPIIAIDDTEAYENECRRSDPCSKKPCLNGGTCKESGSSFKCDCNAPYFGDKCQNDPCSNRPCLNGANCRVYNNSFKCDCRVPYYGDKCQNDPCSNKPCLNGGTCRVYLGSFKCDCKSPYFGDKCQKERRSYKCDFEEGKICSFLSNAKENKLGNWTIGSGKSNAAGIGPLADHTTGTANGIYLFANVSTAKSEKVSLQTVTLAQDYCVRFFYHMHGTNIRSLSVSTQSIGQSSDIRRVFYQKQTQGDRWKETIFTISESGYMKLKGYRIIFTAKYNNGSSLRGDIALDDIELTPGKCKNTKRDVTALCTFDDYDCGYFARKINSSSWIWKSQNREATFFQNRPENDHTLGTSAGGYWLFGFADSNTPKLQKSILSSRVFKKPETNTNCLQFYYYIYGNGTGWWIWWKNGEVKEAYIQAFINYPKSERQTWLTTKAFNITNSRQWNYAEVKADISDDFQLQFVAAIDSSAEVVLAIDDVKLTPGNCPQAERKSYKCDFEEGKICSFLSNAKENQLGNWSIGSGKSIAAGTDPLVDHTTGTANGTYLFANVSTAKSEKVSLQTVTLAQDYCVRFFYHMYGADIRSLRVSTQSIGQSSDIRRVFYQKRTQGDRWKEAIFTIRESGYMKLRGYRIIFTAKYNNESSLRGDIALDDIELTPGKCKNAKSDVTALCTFDEYDCGYFERKTSSISWLWKTQNRLATFFQNRPENDHTLGTSAGGYWLVGFAGSTTPKLQKSILSSRVYKKPETNTNCLQFYYYIYGNGTGWWIWGKNGGVKEAYIQAFINYPKSENQTWLTTKAFNVTNRRQWNYAEVKAEISDDFQLQFVAGIDSSAEVVLAIDDVKLIPGNCPEAGFCDFEEDKCNWKDGPYQYKWVRRTGRAETSNEIGPSSDNTLKTADGNYVVFSTKNKKPGSEANLESEVFPPNDKEMCLTFSYYMSGKDLGNLKIMRREGNVSESVLWLLFNDQGNMWKRAMVVIEPSMLYNQVVFKGVTGRGKNGFTALDDIRIRSGEECKILPPEADPEFEDPCSNEPCKNGGTCNVYGNSFKCNCNKPFFGDQCENDPCSESPCKNGGSCFLMANSYKCVCQAPYIGDKCENDLCTMNPCHNGGICKLNGTSFLCYCRSPYSGKLCEETNCCSCRIDKRDVRDRSER